jgi:hypothetical protein
MSALGWGRCILQFPGYFASRERPEILVSHPFSPIFTDEKSKNFREKCFGEAVKRIVLCLPFMTAHFFES